MSTDKFTAGPSRLHSDPRLDGIALRQSDRRAALASMRAAEAIVAVMLNTAARIRMLFNEILIAPACAVVELSMGSGENVADAIIKIVDTAQHRHNAHG